LAGCSYSDEQSGGFDGGPAPVAAKPKPGGRLVYGLEGDPNGLDPTRNAWDNTGLQLAGALYDPVTAFDADGVPRPYLVEAIEPSNNFTTWTIKLRPNVVFSNGDPLDADAMVGFQAGLRASAITGPPSQLLIDQRALDPLTVQITTSRPWASLPALMAGQGGYVVSPKQIADTEGTSKPIGTGPFTLRNWEINKRFELVRNPRYWRAGLPYLDAVDFVVDESGHDRIAKLQTGQLDATAVSGIWDLRALDEAARAVGPGAIVVEEDRGDAEKANVTFNTSRPPLNDIRVRQAIAYATDVPAIAARNGWPLDRIAQGPFDPASPYYSPAAYPPHDVNRARALLREYQADTKVRNRPRDIGFTVVAPAAHSEFVTQLVEQWGEAGIKVSIDYEDIKQAVRIAVLGQFDALIFRYFAAPDPDILWHFFVSDTVVNTGISLNFAHFRNDEITAGFNDGRANADVAVRKQAYARAQKALAEQLPYLWLQREEWRVATTPRVHDAHNVTLPGGRPAMPLLAGTHRLTETWLDH
jgi:ABC-type transport system substrate-binding protein